MIPFFFSNKSSLLVVWHPNEGHTGCLVSVVFDFDKVIYLTSILIGGKEARPPAGVVDIHVACIVEKIRNSVLNFAARWQSIQNNFTVNTMMFRVVLKQLPVHGQACKTSSDGNPAINICASECETKLLVTLAEFIDEIFTQQKLGRVRDLILLVSQWMAMADHVIIREVCLQIYRAHI